MSMSFYRPCLRGKITRRAVTRPSVTANKLHRSRGAPGVYIARKWYLDNSTRWRIDVESLYCGLVCKQCRGPERTTAAVINGRGCAGVVQKLSAEKTDRTSRCGRDLSFRFSVGPPMNSRAHESAALPLPPPTPPLSLSLTHCRSLFLSLINRKIIPAAKQADKASRFVLGALALSPRPIFSLSLSLSAENTDVW